MEGIPHLVGMAGGRAVDASPNCEEDPEMNFATFQAVGSSGTHFVTTSAGQIPITKIQQNLPNNGQVVGMVSGDGSVQYVRTLEGGASLHATPHLISVPIALPSAKPGDPQPTVQIQVLNPNMLTQQQPKYQMQIPIQGFPQGSAVLTLAYSPEANEAGGIQLLGNSLPEGMQVVAAMPQEIPVVQQHNQDTKEHLQVQHQVYITPNHQIVINPADDIKLNNNTSNNNNNNMGLADIVIKEECDELINDDESSQGTEGSESATWQISPSSQADLIKYLNTLPPQQAQALPASLQQFLRLNCDVKPRVQLLQVEGPAEDAQDNDEDDKKDVVTEAIVGEDGTVRIQTKKKKKYKKKPRAAARPKPGQVVIAAGADGSPLYCCPACHMAYPDKAHLEMHLVVHKIERRFICGICGAGLKRKEHLERHKLGHNPERPYVCAVCHKGFKRREHLNLHTVIHSGVKTELCPLCGKGFYRKDHLRKHTRSHEARRARNEAAAAAGQQQDCNTANSATAGTANVTKTEIDVKPTVTVTQPPADSPASILPEITIHVPTSSNVQVPVQINIPQHIVTSLQAAHAQSHAHTNNDASAQLDALLAHHS